MAEKIIRGIQQIGIGVKNVHEAWKWYRKYFGADVRIFEEEALAELMLPYTGGQPRLRHAVFAINLQGGSGFEIWQYKGRDPLPPTFTIQLGDLGIFSAKIKCRNIEETHALYKKEKLNVSDILFDPSGSPHFFLQDPFGNFFQIVPSNIWFQNIHLPTGSIYGAMIGVSDIEKSKIVYGDILGYDEVIYQKEGSFDDLSYLPGGKGKFRRILLKHGKNFRGGFSKLFGPSQLELIQPLDRNPKKIFDGRYWGDLGFIHLCYDIHGMEALKEECAIKGFPFTVDSFVNHEGNSFDMGEAAGHFSYIEDPDGTLIEFVETHKVLLSKKMRWFLNMKKRDPAKNLPDWLVKALRFNRIKDIEVIKSTR